MKTKCRLCKSDKLVDILSLGKCYLSDFVVSGKKPPKYPLDLVFCTDCTLVQLKKTTPPELLYTKRYGYKSGVSKTMCDELKDIARSAQKFRKNSHNPVVVDIGANDGTLLSFFSDDCLKVGIDPVKKFRAECSKHADIVINDYFSWQVFNNGLGKKKADVVCAIACFYDVDNLNKFVSDVAKILKDDGVFVVQQNYLVEMLKNSAFDNIVHEHLTYFSLSALEKIFAKHDLEIFNAKLRDINGGSLRTYVGYKGKKSISKKVGLLRERERRFRLHDKKTYDKFAKKVKANSHKLAKFIKKVKSTGKKVYIYGASTRGNTLLQFYGLDKRFIEAAVERNPEKWGKKIASVGIPIISEEQARKDNPDYMLVLPWHFRREIIKREKKYLANGGHFIFPLPEFEVI